MTLETLTNDQIRAIQTSAQAVIATDATEDYAAFEKACDPILIASAMTELLGLRACSPTAYELPHDD